MGNKVNSDFNKLSCCVPGLLLFSSPIVPTFWFWLGISLDHNVTCLFCATLSTLRNSWEWKSKVCYFFFLCVYHHLVWNQPWEVQSVRYCRKRDIDMKLAGTSQAVNDLKGFPKKLIPPRVSKQGKNTELNDRLTFRVLRLACKWTRSSNLYFWSREGKRVHVVTYGAPKGQGCQFIPYLSICQSWAFTLSVAACLCKPLGPPDFAFSCPALVASLPAVLQAVL